MNTIRSFDFFFRIDANRTISLSGRIEFEDNLGVLPIPSCIVFMLEDISLADASSFVVGQQYYNLSGVEIKKVYEFAEFTVPKPIEKDLHDQYAISAFMMIDHCIALDGRDPKVGDWYTDTNFYVPLNKDADVYNNITMTLTSKYL